MRCLGTLRGVIVGYIAINNSYIDRLYVDPDECRRGLGSRFYVPPERRTKHPP
jgi:hypothetical protein